MKRRVTLLLACVCALAIALCGAAAFGAEPGIVHHNDYAAAFSKVVSAGDAKNMKLEKLDKDLTGKDGVTIPAGSLELTCDTTTTGNVNIFYTRSKVVNMEKPVIIKWRENFAGNMAEYFIGIGSADSMKGDPGALAEFSFDQTWGSAYNNAGTMQSAFKSKGTAVGKWDLGTGEHPLARGAYHFYQLRIEYNTATSKYDVTLSYEAHDGSAKATLATYSVDIAPSTFSGGAYLFLNGSSHETAAPSIYLLNDTRSGRLAGTSFADWFHSATVTDEAGLAAAIADTSVNSIDCVVSDTFKNLSGMRTISRSLNLRSVDKNGDLQRGTAGMIFEDGLTVSGKNTVFKMESGCGNFIVDGASATFEIVSMGYNKTGAESGKPDHCIEVKNGGKVKSSWSALDCSAKGAVKLSGGSTYEVPANDNAASTYSLASLVDVTLLYPGVIPAAFCDSQGVARVYAVMEGEGNKLLGFDKLTPPLVAYETESNGTFMIQYSPIEDFAFDKTAIETAVGATVSGALQSTQPEAPTNLTAFSYRVEDESIAEVTVINQGLGFKVTGKKAGTTNLVITTTDRIDAKDAVTKKIPVTVTAPTVVGFEVDHSKVQKELAFGTELDLSKLAVSAKYSDDTTQALAASDYTVDLGGFDKDKAGTYTVTVTYGSYAAQTFEVTVREAEGGGCGSCNKGDATASLLGVLLLAGAAFAIKR